jgi:hypothetical protein
VPGVDICVRDLHMLVRSATDCQFFDIEKRSRGLFMAGQATTRYLAYHTDQHGITSRGRR